MFDFASFPTLETERLVLREITGADINAIFGIRGDYNVTRYNIGPAYHSPNQARDLIGRMADQYREEKEIRWGVTLRPASERPDAEQADSGSLVVGMCGFNYWHRLDRRASIGFDLARAYWGRGIMTETVRAVLEFGFTEMGLNRIEADTSSENEPCKRLLLRLGFREEGMQRQQYYEEGRFHDLILYGMLRAEWHSESGSEADTIEHGWDASSA